MTDKELLYIEDSLGHIKQLKAIFKDYLGKINDEDLIDFLNDSENEIQKINKNIFNLLNI